MGPQFKSRVLHGRDVTMNVLDQNKLKMSWQTPHGDDGFRPFHTDIKSKKKKGFGLSHVGRFPFSRGH